MAIPFDMEFKLLVPVTEALATASSKAVIVDGQRWVLTDPLQEPDIPPYACISYVWGDALVPHREIVYNWISTRQPPFARVH